MVHAVPRRTLDTIRDFDLGLARRSLKLVVIDREGSRESIDQDRLDGRMAHDPFGELDCQCFPVSLEQTGGMHKDSSRRGGTFPATD
jgi:hypothetical protein